MTYDILLFMAGIADDDMPPPDGISVWSHTRSVDLSFHDGSPLVAYGRPTTAAAMTAGPLGRADILLLIAGIADDDMPPPDGISVWSHTRSVDLSFHDGSPALVRSWASILGLGEPAYGDVCTRDGSKPYRALKADGRLHGYDVAATSFIDIADDPTGLEGTGWLDEVWIATRRRGVTAHRPDGDERTVCGRSTRTGERTTARQATDQHAVSYNCATCWPTGSPIVSESGGAA